MTEAEEKVEFARIEAQKEALRDHKKVRDKLSFDEAVFDAAKPKLKKILEEVSACSNIYDGTDLFQKYQTFCVDQIKKIVDLQICQLLTRPQTNHVTRPGRHSPVIRRDHDLLVSHSKYLVEVVEKPKSWIARRKRYRSIAMTVEQTMNAIDWRGLTVSFYNAVK